MHFGGEPEHVEHSLSIILKIMYIIFIGCTFILIILIYRIQKNMIFIVENVFVKVVIRCIDICYI